MRNSYRIGGGDRIRIEDQGTSTPPNPAESLRTRSDAKTHFTPPSDERSVRFWDKVVRRRSGCWEWIGTRNRKGGYGRLKFGGKMAMAHRVAKELATGIAPGDLCVLHHCDNPPCVNPAHLYFGTRADNARDCVSRGRHCNAQKTHCKRGHSLTDNPYIRSDGRRECRPCDAARNRRRRATPDA